MIYGDNPNKINEREDALGLKTYTYSPSINSIMQSGNLYVYCMNSPILLMDYSGEIGFLCTLAIGAGIGAIASGITQIIENVNSDAERYKRGILK
ncbi:MAG: hypothetical protein IJ945_06745 [Oscillospiraceae bacterium]|nr:hypothetical protein [Oscillospiraceae bacterium]